jgi:hypothetical protein
MELNAKRAIRISQLVLEEAVRVYMGLVLRELDQGVCNIRVNGETLLIWDATF